MDTSSSNVYGLPTQKSRAKLNDSDQSNIKINQTTEEPKVKNLETEELRELKGLKISKKKKIETSVQL